MLENIMIRGISKSGLFAAAFVSVVAAYPAYADGTLNRGDAVVTGFSGVTVAVPSAADPMDGTFIDVDGPAMKVLPLDAGAPPAGQLLSNPSRLDVKARDVGQVF